MLLQVSVSQLSEASKTPHTLALLSSVFTLLEAFGHAKTLRNINSSRFGSCARLHLVGAHLKCVVIDTFLLDSLRCVRQPRSERSFHVLYQLCAGALTPDQRDDFNLSTADAFTCLNCSGTIYAEGVDDCVSFKDTVASLEAVGLCANGRLGLWRLLAAILNLSNVRFCDGADGSAKLEIGSEVSLQLASRLLGITTDLLLTNLISRKSPQVVSSASVPNCALQAAVARDGLASCLYSRAFAAVVALSNAALNLDCGNRALPSHHSSGSSAETAAAVSDAISVVAQQGGSSSSPVVEVYDLLGAENLAHNGYHTLCTNLGDVSYLLLHASRASLASHDGLRCVFHCCRSVCVH